ncbi:MAG TPA: rRNA maturation RNase YbeY [Burkholderiales bacterium]|nr:rRNA maturation RNase YbeY [Burkholderiales bacterium]
MPTRLTSRPRTSNRDRIDGDRPGPLRLDLTVQFAVQRNGIPTAARFRKWALAALIETASVALRLVNRAEALALNSTYRHRHYATNVLTFAYPDTRPLSGDMVLCIPVIREEARQQGKSLHAHLAHLTVHGMLHLQGFDHGTDDEAELMEGIETEIVSKLGYADPYSPSARP